MFFPALALTVWIITPAAAQSVSIVNVTGSGVQLGTAISTDAFGSGYLAGYTDSRALNIPGLSASPSCPGGTNAFVIKFAANTSTPLWAKCFGGSSDDRAYSVAIGADGTIYVAGTTNSLDFPGSAGSIRSAGGQDGFVTKLSADGRTILWSRLMGGSSNDSINAIYVSASGDVYVGGQTQSSDLPTVNPISSRLLGYQNGFLAHLDSTGTVRYCTYVGGSGHDRVLAISADAQGNAYVAGSTDSVNFPTVNAVMATRRGPVTGFVLKISNDGARFLFSTYLGGSHGVAGAEQVNAIAVSLTGTVYVGGVTSSSDFPTVNAYQSGFRGWNSDGYVAALARDGNSLLFSTFLGGSQSDSVAALKWNESASTITVVGPTMSTNFPGLATASGSFMVEFYSSGQYRQTLGALDPGLIATSVAPGAGQNLYISGTCQGANAFMAFRAVTATPSSPSGPALLWMNDSNRQVKAWYMTGSQGSVYSSSNWLDSTGRNGWTVAGYVDLDKDGVSDLVWQNDTTRQLMVSYMGGSQGTVATGSNLLTTADVPGWKVVGLADFTSDGHLDLVWQNESSRQATVWYMGGAQGNVFLGWNWLVTTDMRGWKIAGIADFNGDGKPDLVWQNDSSRQAVVWFMGGAQGTTYLGSSNLTAGDVVGWRIAAVGDFNRDGRPDVVWLNDSSRQVTLWYLGGPQGTTLTSWLFLDSTGQPGWSVVAAR